jgi:hypothetical protein
VPTYRIYYAERQVGDQRSDSPLSNIPSYRVSKHTDYVSETEWEEEVQGRDGASALEAFFREHVRDRSQVMWVDEQGESQPLTGVADYEPDRTYIWVENDKLMEYQGLDEATPGMVSCPLCDGAGEVTVEVADEYLGEYGEGIVEREPEQERPTWG